jgi:F-type H+-transporting ATPase subunit b
MSICTKLASWCAVVAFAAIVAAAGQCAAQNTDEVNPKVAARFAAVEAEASEHDTAGPNPLGFSKDLAIWTLVVFILLFLVLKQFAWPQITEALVERERKIEATIAAADAKLEDAKRVLAEHDAKLAAAAGEVRELLEEARRDADHTRKSIEADGQKAAKEELERARREIERARDAAIKDLAVASANTAIELARNVIKANLTPEQNNQLIREAVAKLEPSKN